MRSLHTFLYVCNIQEERYTGKKKFLTSTIISLRYYFTISISRKCMICEDILESWQGGDIGEGVDTKPPCQDLSTILKYFHFLKGKYTITGKTSYKIFIKGATSTIKGKIRDKSRSQDPNKDNKLQQNNQQRTLNPQEGHL